MIEFQFIDLPPVSFDYLDKWLNLVCDSEGKQLGALSVVIGSDEWLLEQNIKFLNHDYYTDIITFDYVEGGVISGDLLISLDRVTDNAKTYNVSRETELNRVIVHGVLHLCGYGDQTPEEVKIMREKENYYLQLL